MWVMMMSQRGFIRCDECAALVGVLAMAEPIHVWDLWEISVPSS